MFALPSRIINEIIAHSVNVAIYWSSFGVKFVDVAIDSGYFSTISEIIICLTIYSMKFKNWTQLASHSGMKRVRKCVGNKIY